MIFFLVRRFVVAHRHNKCSPVSVLFLSSYSFHCRGLLCVCVLFLCSRIAISPSPHPIRSFYFYLTCALFFAHIRLYFNSIVSPFYGLRRAMAVTAWNIIYSLWLYNLNFFLSWQEQYFCIHAHHFTHTHKQYHLQCTSYMDTCRWERESHHSKSPLNDCYAHTIINLNIYTFLCLAIYTTVFEKKYANVWESVCRPRTHVLNAEYRRMKEWEVKKKLKNRVMETTSEICFFSFSKGHRNHPLYSHSTTIS